MEPGMERDPVIQKWAVAFRIQDSRVWARRNSEMSHIMNTVKLRPAFKTQVKNFQRARLRKVIEHAGATWTRGLWPLQKELTVATWQDLPQEVRSCFRKDLRATFTPLVWRPPLTSKCHQLSPGLISKIQGYKEEHQSSNSLRKFEGLSLQKLLSLCTKTRTI